MAYIFGSIWDRFNRNALNDLSKSVEQQGKSIQDLVAKGQLTPTQYATLIQAVNGLISKGEVSPLDINKSLGGFDATFFTNEFLDQLNNGTIEATKLLTGSVTKDKIANKAVTYDKTDFLNIGVNLYDKTKSVEGNLNYDGTVIDSSVRLVTDYIPIKSGDSIYFTYNFEQTGGTVFNNAIHLYDNQYNFIERILDYESGNKITTSNVAFIRTSITKAIEQEQLVISKVPVTSYEAHHKVFNGVKVLKEDIVGLNDTANIESHLAGKTLVCFGDSITGNYFENDYPSIIAMRTGMTVHNVGFGGTRLGRHWGEFDKFSFYNLVDNITSGDFSELKTAFSGRPAQFDERVSILESIDFNNVDYISIAYGANDWGDNTPNDKSNPEDPTSFIGAGRLGLRKLLQAYPHLKIMVISPFYRWFPTDSPINDSDNKDVSGFYLYEYIESAKTIAKEFKSPFYDAYYNLGINKYNRTLYFDGNDGTHPNAKGRKTIGESVASRILSEW